MNTSTYMVRAFPALVLLLAITTAEVDAQPRTKPKPASGWQTFWATAYCLDGTTRSGTETRPGTIAADPRVLPLGSLVRIEGIGRHRTFTVLDTGAAVSGRKVDIFLSDCRAAKRFGRQKVWLRVVRRGPAGRTMPETSASLTESRQKGYR